MPKHSFKKLSLAARCAIVAAITVAFALSLCMIMGAVAFASEDPTKNLTLYGEICFLLSMFFCGFVGAKTAGESRFASGIFASGIVLLLVIAASVAFGGDSFIKELTMAALGVAVSASGAALGSRETKRKHRR
ncbi:MAG: hypothetical protein E7598_00535 [Ruminococcaceae bacterium]|nr:hypothetical protein [Oscillospiraceae bacterium]